MARLCLSFDIHHFEIEELSFLTLWWDFRKEASIWHRFRLLILTRLAGLPLQHRSSTPTLVRAYLRRVCIPMRYRPHAGESVWTTFCLCIRRESTHLTNLHENRFELGSVRSQDAEVINKHWVLSQYSGVRNCCWIQARSWVVLREQLLYPSGKVLYMYVHINM